LPSPAGIAAERGDGSARQAGSILKRWSGEDEEGEREREREQMSLLA
jgi:hypothetical protein